MKYLSFTLLSFCLLVSGCGQPGPLYLPTDKPPIYVEPDSEPETKESEPKLEKPKELPQSEINQPAKEQ
jgi:predicted small lipoprotein YifL